MIVYEKIDNSIPDICRMIHNNVAYVLVVDYYGLAEWVHSFKFSLRKLPKKIGK